MNTRRAFTLVEILVVFIILGILVAIVIPQFTEAMKETIVKVSTDEGGEKYHYIPSLKEANSKQFAAQPGKTLKLRFIGEGHGENDYLELPMSTEEHETQVKTAKDIAVSLELVEKDKLGLYVQESPLGLKLDDKTVVTLSR